MAYSTYKREESVDSKRRHREYSCLEMMLTYIFFRRRSIYNIENEDERDMNSGLDTDNPEGISAAGIGVTASSERSAIRVTDNKQKLLLGARLETQSSSKEQALMKSRHFVKLTTDTNLAKQIKIKDGDELLLLNEIFVPVLTHGQVLELFLKISLDGQSTNKLVVRRRKRNHQWKWYELFFILTPLPQTGIKVTRPKCNKMKRSTMELPESEHIYKIPETQLYLVIDETGLKTKILFGDDNDKTKVMKKRKVICEHGDGEIHFDVALRDKEMSRYIAVNTKTEEIILAEDPQWFDMSKIGDGTHFMTKGFYLGYDQQEDKVKPVRSKYMFKEFPLPGHLNR